MIIALESQGAACRITKFLRKKKTAHRWSTAHHIVNGTIEIGLLRNLPDGKDRDGNLWYRQEWDGAYLDDESASASEPIRFNAVTLGAPGTAYAEEGYAADDPRRLPNVRGVPISKHVLGLAIDVLVDWSSLGGPWSERANSVVAHFGLVRPRDDEPWHFELESGNAALLLSLTLAAPHRILFWSIRYFANRWKKEGNPLNHPSRGG